MSIVILIVLVLIVIVLRAVAKNHSEKSGLDICPKCKKKMEMGVIRARYHCPYCGYKQPGYF